MMRGSRKFRLSTGEPSRRLPENHPSTDCSMPIKSCFLNNLLEMTRNGIQVTAKGRPVDLVFEQAMHHPMFCTFCNRCQLQREDRALPRLHQAVRLHHRGLDHILGSHPKGKVKASHKGLWQSRCHRGSSKVSLGHAMAMQFVLTIMWTSANCQWIVVDAVKGYTFAVIVDALSKTIRIRHVHCASPQPDNET